MAKLQWLKTRVGLFSDPRVIFLLNQPNGDSYLTLWTFLKDMAGIVNDNGKIYVAEKEPLSVALIAKCLHRRKPFIENGLAILQHLNLIEQQESGLICIKIWDELQDFQRDEHRRELNAKRQQRYRERQRQSETKDTSVVALTPQSADADSSPNLGRLESCGKCLPADTEMDTRQYPPENADGEPELVQNVGSYQSVQTYKRLFHGINSTIAQKLVDLEKAWGTEGTCKAIEIASDAGVRHVNYIQTVLVNANGKPTKRGERKEKENYYGYDSFDEYVKSVLSGEYFESDVSQDAERVSA